MIRNKRRMDFYLKKNRERHIFLDPENFMFLLFSISEVNLFSYSVNAHFTRITFPCNVYPLKSHFYILNKTGVCRGRPIFLIFAPKHRF